MMIKQPALAPSPQPRPAPTVRALPAELAAQRGPFWMPIRGPNPTPIDKPPELVLPEPNDLIGYRLSRNHADRTWVCAFTKFKINAPKAANGNDGPKAVVLVAVVVHRLDQTAETPNDGMVLTLDHTPAEGDLEEFVQRLFRPFRLREIPLRCPNAVGAQRHVSHQPYPRLLCDFAALLGTVLPSVPA